MKTISLREFKNSLDVDVIDVKEVKGKDGKVYRFAIVEGMTIAYVSHKADLSNTENLMVLIPDESTKLPVIYTSKNKIVATL